MVFMIEETSFLATFLNLTSGGGAVAPIFADRLDVQAKVDSGHIC